MKKVLGKVTLFAAIAMGALAVHQTAAADSYTIQNGDSFYSIAQAHGVDVYELAAANGLGIYDLILPGQVLTIPGNAAASSAQPAAPSAPAPTTNTGTAQTVSYTVKNGDSFSSIAAAYGMDYNQLAANNGLTINDYILPGQVLQVSSSAPAASTNTNQSSSYYLEGYTYEPGNTYPVGQCTWAVKKLTGWAGDWWGNAASWATNAARDGYVVGTTPVVGSIVVWNDGAYGHVAYVTAVESAERIQVSEANINGRQWIDNHRGWFNPLNTNSQVSYIYPKG